MNHQKHSENTFLLFFSILSLQYLSIWMLPCAYPCVCYLQIKKISLLDNKSKNFCWPYFKPQVGNETIVLRHLFLILLSTVAWIVPHFVRVCKCNFSWPDNTWQRLNWGWIYGLKICCLKPNIHIPALTCARAHIKYMAIRSPLPSTQTQKHMVSINAHCSVGHLCMANTNGLDCLNSATAVIW